MEEPFLTHLTTLLERNNYHQTTGIAAAKLASLIRDQLWFMQNAHGVGLRAGRADDDRETAIKHCRAAILALATGGE